MSVKFVKAAALALTGVLSFSASAVMAQEAKSLDELLNYVKQGQVTEAKENRAREAKFSKDKANQAAALKRAEAERARQEQLSAELEAKFEENQLLIAAKQEQLQERLGTLTELFGHLTSAAGDLSSNLEVSLASAQYPGREVFLKDLIDKMSSSDQLPSIEEIERVWFELMREIRETGVVTKFDAEVASPAGERAPREVLRVGAFNLVDTDGNYLSYDSGSLSELPRQPSGPYTGWAADLANATGGLNSFGIDPTGPTGGSFLAAIIDTPTLEERWHQGGYVGYAITAVGIFAFLLAIWRMIVLTAVGAKVNSQLKSDKANDNNPLGRVLKIHEDNPTMDTETLELKLSEGVLKETPKLESGLTLLKIIAAVAPLMGLLGTVTGMIITFQAITIFGAGDPKAMAGGISGALITTVLGLLVAIPTVLLHTVVNGRAQRIIHILDEQTTGMIAEHTEANLRS
ncbi:energy transducer TonB [Halioglobus japonicus]|uniref:Energy transducer TonB n=1 Tax=Halioglobus japonicus TaxID=930805 RepID=A0AAP8MCV4_9GAMM|nr:MotA/TolQ/ExbB proton channel family protein [Halioglobus japonicus]AQA17533.1 energy transducer TonB [Halioglobus japonicus]PLW85468.1 energy transducer TonB [Halioglobus japonicus]GHD15790.1 biopolymer transporter ExbB [Halioglobus japonicus]